MKSAAPAASLLRPEVGLPPLPPPRIIGHRGAAAHAPENTLASLRKAHELGARWVEFDVQATRDDCAVLLHDARLERTTDGYGLLADTEARAVARLDAGRWFGKSFRGEGVPRFSAAMELIGELGMGAIVEIKAEPGDGARTARAVLTALGQSAAPHILSSFGADALAVAAAERPDTPRALIVRSIPEDWRARVERLGCTALHAGERELTPKIVAEVARHCVLRAYTVNSPDRASELLAWGASAVFTDCPDVILSGIGHITDGPAGPRGSKAQ
jgi:glycerophosphoryl diester phosphodiesterase